MEAIDQDIERFLHVETGSGDGDGSGDGSVSGYGYGSGYGYVSGSGDGDGYGSGYGYGYGSGSCYGYGSGYGYGDGSGYGYGYGDGYGSCYGYGDGYGIEAIRINGAKKARRVYMIDGVQTIILRIRAGVFAHAAILNADLTITPCYVYRKGDCFAHGATLHDAVRDAEAKWMESRPLDERIAEFVANHPDPDTPYDDLFEWHHILTGSCEAGRKAWCKDHGYEPTDSITVKEFIKNTAGDYGGDIIKQLSKHYGKETHTDRR